MTPVQPADMPLRVLANELLDERHFRLTLEADGPVAEFLPGQFVMLRCSESLTLRRPLSIQRLLRDGSFACIEILYRVVGSGTRALAAIGVGETVDCLAPLGRPFDLPAPSERAVLLGGGVGIPPMVALAEEIVAQGGRTPLVIGGVGGQGDAACLTGLLDLEIPVHVSTLDGSAGTRGTVLDALDARWGGGPGLGDRIYACGPAAMLVAVARMARRWDLGCQISLEAVMGCGFGACVGCAVPRAGGSEYALVCRDGPVFEMDEVDLEAMESGWLT